MNRSFKYSPLPTDSKNAPYFAHDLVRCACYVGIIAMSAFIFCIIWSILYNFKESTSTHCNVYNFLPSISAAIGSYSPQKYVWRYAIFIHIIPRFIIPFEYNKYFRQVLTPTAYLFGRITVLFNVLEMLALLGLSNWSSIENYPLHKFSFLSFVVNSVLYMLLSCILLQWYRRIPATNIEFRSLRMKWKLFLLHVASFLTAAYCFMRHTWYCEPGVYSVFALAEYMVVFTNIAFHFTICWDFYGKSLVYDHYGLYFY